jgi:deaminated glutathione amidase
VVDPWGEVLVDAGEGTKLATAEIELSRITDVRSRVPALKHRRDIGKVVTA